MNLKKNSSSPIPFKQSIKISFYGLFMSLLLIGFQANKLEAQIVKKDSKKGIPDYISQAYPFAIVKPIALADAKITGGYMGTYYDRIRDISISDLYAKMEKHGSFNNFKIVADGLPDRHVGGFNQDEWVHKLVEAAAYFAPGSDKIKDEFQPLISTILSSQDKDGYLQTFYQNPSYIKKNAPNVRFQPKGRHEFYVFGHLAQAGMAWKRTTGDDRIFQASLRYADLLCNLFENKPLPYNYEEDRGDRKYDHPNHEMAMVELYRMTGNKRYLDFAAHTLDYYGFWKFPEVHGHCVQENLLLCGGADVYLESGKSKRYSHLEAMWTDITQHKSYLTGGVGNGIDMENYGKPFVLPNTKNYCETCAAISKVFFDWRMLLASNQIKYTDDLEQTFYNAVLPGISLSGTEYFYTNHMEEAGNHTVVSPESNIIGVDVKDSQRKPYFDCSCCAPNIHRLIGSLQQYLFTTTNDGVQTHLYGNAEFKVQLSSGETVRLRETTDYPRDGKIQFDIMDDGKFSLSLRIPKWTEGSKVNVKINGKSESHVKAGDYLKVDKKWKKGDQIVIEFDITPRLVKGRELVADEKSKLAIMRGPMVYCLESPDNGKTDIFNLSLPADAKFVAEQTKELGGTVKLIGKAWDQTQKAEVQITAIPYQLWANRGESQMRIWIPEKKVSK